MDNKTSQKMPVKKIILIAGACFAVLLICLLVSAMQISKSKIAYLGNFLEENLHTGFTDSPVGQIALNNLNENSNQFASKEPQDNIPDKQDVAMGENPTVLFDISTRPVLGRTSAMDIIWVIFAVCLCLWVIYLIRGVYKSKRLKKIKEISRIK